MNLYLSLLVALWMTVNHFLLCSSDGVIKVLPEALAVTEGENSSFNCTAVTNNTNATGLNFTWRRSDGDIVLSSANLLTIKDAYRNDSGNYSCTATNGTANWSAVATLTVLYPPQIVHSTKNLTVNESSKTTLFCNASGYPSPIIQWGLPNGTTIRLANNKNLELSNTSKSQHGKYSCQATNNVGNSSTEVMYLNVQYKPKINITGRKSKINSRLHLNSTLICQADGNPHPVVTWSKDNKPLSKKYMPGKVHIMPESDADFGIYICTAWNALGEDKFHVDVNRTAFPPDAPRLLNTEEQLSNRFLFLNWTLPESNGRNISGFFVWHRKLFSNSSKGSWTETGVGLTTYFNITLEWDTSYEFVVTAENDQGKSNRSNSWNVTVLPKPTDKPTSSSTPSKDSKPLALFAGIGGGVGGGLLIITVIATLFCVKRKRRSRAQPMQPLFNLQELQSKISESKSSILQNSNTYNPMPTPTERRPRKSENLTPTSSVLEIYSNVSCLDGETSHWEFPREEVHIKKYVGKGAFCVVAKAFVDGLGIVAVKTPKAKAPESNKKDLLAEYELMKPLRHPNVIQLMGAVTRSDPVMVMFEYIPYGDLLGFLKRSRGLEDKYYKDPDVKPSSWLTSEQLLKFAREIADGMAYLAANKIIHRDLAARNVLVGEAETCKITDFGMARDVHQNDIYQKRSKSRLPVKWTAIESLLYGVCTTKSDVWSYGIVLYEIFTIGGKPYPNINGHRIPYLLKDNYRMPKPVHLDDEIYALMCECWQTDPNSRPTFESISSTIKRLQRCRKDVIYMNVYDENLYGNVEDWD